MTRSVVVVWVVCALFACRTKESAPQAKQSPSMPPGSFEWNGDDPGWIAGFADCPSGVDKDWHFESGVRPLPVPLTSPHRALFIGGDNHSDDLFMFWKRAVGGLEPGKTYNATLSVELPTNAPKGCSGVGGAPGESVYVKLGAATHEPTVAADPSGALRVSIDKGNQSTSGSEAVVVGNVATTNSDCKAPRWEIKQLQTQKPITVKADDRGFVWILVGTDSGFEARSEVYYSTVRLQLAAAPPGAMTALASETITPAAFPDPGIPGFHFPEAQATVDGWTANNDQTAMTKHAWGVWTSLTADSGEKFHGESLRVFETWATPDDLVGDTQAKGIRNLRPLQELRQFKRRRTAALLSDHGDQTVTGFVKLDPTAAAFITTNKLFSGAQLATFASKGNIPDLPATAISLKAVFMTLASSTAIGGHYVQLANWPGPPSPAKPFPQADWKQCVWIDINDPSDGHGTTVDTKCAPDGSSRSDANTYGLGRFIHFQLSAQQADDRNALVKSLDASRVGLAKAGDYSVLVGMHVTTRETTRWTWATFWWTPVPDAPPSPSSPAIAAQRPAQLTGAARSYAHCVANMMELPSQPNTGGKNQGESVYCYNPWLEAPFGPDDLPDSEPGTSQHHKVANNVGVQTNCMSCHAQAYFDPNHGPDPQGHYTGDRYVDLAASTFTGMVRTDFLWSIADVAGAHP